MKKTEVAWLYSPNVSQCAALNRLKRWMDGDEELTMKLKQLGYKNTMRVLSPAIVKALVEHLGEPE